MLKRFFVRFNQSQPPQILVHPGENIPFESAEAAELYVKNLKHSGEFYIFDYKIYEADTLPVESKGP